MSCKLNDSDWYNLIHGLDIFIDIRKIVLQMSSVYKTAHP